MTKKLFCMISTALLLLSLLSGCGMKIESAEDYQQRVNGEFDEVLAEIQDALDRDLPLDDSWDEWEPTKTFDEVYDALKKELQKAEASDKKYAEHMADWDVKEDILIDTYEEKAGEATSMVMEYSLSHLGDLLSR